MEFTKAQINKLPQGPGVYLYKNENQEIIYVGKAKNLLKRVRQYFQKILFDHPKTRRLVEQIHYIQIIKTLSEFDALLLEAKLINQLKPKYNIAARDDKSPLYVVVSLDTKNPGVFVKRGRELERYKKRKYYSLFGPFQSGKMTRMLLGEVRRVIPFCTQKNFTGKPCFYTQLGLCDPCPSEFMQLNMTERREQWIKYKKHLQGIEKIFDGKSLMIEEEFNKEMLVLSRAEKFEGAARMRNQIDALQKLREQKFNPDVYLTRNSFLSDQAREEMLALGNILENEFSNLTRLSRIECFDISNISGKYAVGSMTVLTEGIPDNGQYRRFKIKGFNHRNDVGAIEEVVSRRLKHPEWQLPDLLVVDGGKGQVKAAVTVVKRGERRIPVIGLAKRREEIIIYIHGEFKTIRLPIDRPAVQLLQRVRDEAHRFGLSYHRLLRRKAFLNV